MPLFFTLTVLLLASAAFLIRQFATGDLTDDWPEDAPLAPDRSDERRHAA